MFETLETPSQFSVWRRYLVQLFLCYPAAWIVGSVTSSLVSSIGIGNHGRIHFDGYAGVLLFCLAAFAGCAVARLNPSLSSTARWIWVLPVTALVYDIVSLRHPIPWPSESLFETPGEGGIGPYLVGLPAFVAAGYSAGVMLYGRSRTQGLRPRPVFIGFGIFVAILLIGLHEFERTSLEKWSKVRVLLVREVRFSNDAADLCANPESGEFISPDAYVELLGERRACAGNRLLARDDPGPPRSFIVDRVRIVMGSHAGAEGWVFEYLLGDPYSMIFTGADNERQRAAVPIEQRDRP